MVSQTPENCDDGQPFPVTDYWEEWIDSWEGDVPDDPLGPDHAARFETITVARRRGLLGPEAEAAIVTRDQIANLVQPLLLADPDPIIDELWSLAGRHLRPLHRKLLGSDPASTAGILKKVTKAATELERLIDTIPPVTRDFLEQCYVRLPASYRHGEKLDINALDFTLSNLAYTTYLAELTLTRERRQPPKVLRLMTLKHLVDLIQSSTGTPVKHSWKKDAVNYAFKGANGAIVRDFMNLVEPRASERSLVEDLIKIRRPTR